MSTAKRKNVPNATIARWIRLDLEGRAAIEPATFHTLASFEETTGLTPEGIEEVARGMEGVSVVPAGTIRKTQADFPLFRRKGEGTGHFPGIKLETESERKARELRAAILSRAADALQGAVAHLGLHVTEDLQLVPVEGSGAESIEQAIIVALGEAV